MSVGRSRSGKSSSRQISHKAVTRHGGILSESLNSGREKKESRRCASIKFNQACLLDNLLRTKLSWAGCHCCIPGVDRRTKAHEIHLIKSVLDALVSDHVD